MLLKVPVIVPIQGGESVIHVPISSLVFTWLFLILVCLIIFLIRALIWKFEEINASFFRYTIYDKDAKYGIPLVNTALFILTNFAALTLILAHLIVN